MILSHISLNMMVIIQGIVDNSLYAPQLGILFMATGAIAFNVANDKIIKRKVHINKKDKKSEGNSGSNEVAV